MSLDCAEVRQRLDPWSQRHLARLAELEAHAPAAVSGDTLLHFDIRADNVLLGAEPANGSPSAPA